MMSEREARSNVSCWERARLRGDRSEASCLHLWLRIPRAYKRCYSFSDFWDTYRAVFAIDRHQSVGKDSGETNHIKRWFNAWIGLLENRVHFQDGLRL